MRKQRIFILSIAGGIFLLGVVYLLLLRLTSFEGVPCVFHEWTGLLCPGCGLTRAAQALLDGKPLLALSYNPLFPLYILYAGIIFVSAIWGDEKKKDTSFPRGPLWIHLSVLGIVVLFWIVRNI